MNINNLFITKQYGFIRGRSTVLQLVQVIDSWVKILDMGGCIDVVYIAILWKHTIKSLHRRLIQKLEYYGVDNPVLVSINDFLQDRKQRVIVNGQTSNWHSVLSGIPQGSVLELILLVICINTLPFYKWYQSAQGNI